MTAAIVLRSLHFAAAATLFGEFVFALAIAASSFAADAAAWRRLARVAAWSLALLVASGAAWLAVQAQAMSGAPMREALSREVVGAVVGETLFGRVSLARLGLALALTAVLLVQRGARPGSRGVLCAGTLLSGALLATIAWTGHAAAEQGADRIVHLGADVLHLLAAGAWVGALWPLAVTRARDMDAARTAHRFSMLGVASVATLLVTGVANAWYTVGSVHAMIGTDYGRLLSAKLALFAAMLVFAAVNRWRLTPRVDRGDAQALACLRRNAAVEAALGLGVLAIVGALGVTVPALHEQTVWPLAYTLEVPEGAEALVGALFVAPLFAFALAVAGLRAGRRALVGAGAGVVVAALACGLWLCAVPAHPTTYFVSPVRYAADSIVRGAALYREHCAACHGERARGDGPAAASLAVRPADLAAHWSHHREGDVYWWIERGIPGAAMPAFAGTIPEKGVWDVLNLLRADADAVEAQDLTDRVRPRIGVAAPDFAFQMGTRPQESLADLRGQTVLLVFYELPGSLERLRALAEAGVHFGHLGARVVALPVRGRSARPDGDAEMLADPDPRVAAAYALFAPGGVARPVEYLVDRQGDIRARWVPGATPGWGAMPVLLGQIDALEREPPRPLPRRRHAH